MLPKRNALSKQVFEPAFLSFHYGSLTWFMSGIIELTETVEIAVDFDGRFYPQRHSTGSLPKPSD